ncbi:MAG: aconitase X swivel domain-containing protein [Beijerinckiaceae bacterium]
MGVKIMASPAGHSCQTFFHGQAQGPALVLQAPLSFWGGVDPQTGTIIAVRHPQCGHCVSGRVLVMPEPIGSSSSSAVLLELIHGGRAPAGIILGQADAILVVGCLVAHEMGWGGPPVLVDPHLSAHMPDDGAALVIDDCGWRAAGH